VRALPLFDRPVSLGLGGAIGAAMIPVAFAYGGWQTASFVAGEMRDPRRDLSRGLVIGVIGVVTLYLAVNFVCLRVLGPDGLAATRIPASAVMRAALGERGAKWIAFGIAISTLGFLSQGILTAPRVYYAMARDGLFFRSTGKLSKKGVPQSALIYQGIWIIVLILLRTRRLNASGAVTYGNLYSDLLNYVVFAVLLFYVLTIVGIFVLRRKRPDAERPYRAFGYPFVPFLYIVAATAIMIVLLLYQTQTAGGGLAIVLLGLPVYWFWSRRSLPAAQSNE
jgi:basic amino acid/polyamine antiporter, APA family